MSTSDDNKPKGYLSPKKRPWTLAIFALIIIAAIAAGTGGAARFSTTSSVLTTPEKNAISAAKQYLQTLAFSKQGLINQLDSPDGSGFSASVATAAVDSLNVNWTAEAVQSAKDYLKTESFSCQGLIQQLSSSAGSGYTLGQAQYAAKSVGLCGSGGKTHSSSTSSGVTVSEKNAIGAAKQYLQTEAFSKQGLIDQLDSPDGSGFSVRVATAAVDSLNVNWAAEAVQSAKEYLRTESFSCQGLIQQLSSSAGSRYTLAQAQYAAKRVGLC